MPTLPTARVVCGDAAREMGKLAPASFDAVITDSPYPEVSRGYGRLSESDWHALMDIIVPECRRVLKPTGSAVFILQPNSRKAGEMRLWLWEFVVKWGRAWNLVQDVYWWNYAILPMGGATQQGLLRSSVKMCVWFGQSDCYRNQDAALWSESEVNATRRIAQRNGERVHLFASPSAKRSASEAHRLDQERARNSAERRGGVTPFNVIPASNTATQSGPTGVANFKAHPARTPQAVVDWWVRYLTPEGGTVLDPFVGSGTTIFSALDLGRNAVGIEKEPEYVEQIERRLSSLT